MQIIDTASVAILLSQLAPHGAWLLEHIESEGGYVTLPPQVAEWISRLKIENYPELYEDEKRIGTMMIRAFFDASEIPALDQDLTTLSPGDRGAFLLEFMQELKAAGDLVEWPQSSSETQQMHAAVDLMSPSQQQESVRSFQYMAMALLAGFHQTLSIMVHGQRLTSLVARAKEANDKVERDKAFAKAVQIDKRILVTLPYFREKFAAANMSGDHKFTEYVGAHLSRPPYKGKVRHKTLYLAFAFLELAGLLDGMKHRELLDLINDAGLNESPNRIEDVKNLSRRLAEYRAFQGRVLDLSTPSKPF